MRGVRGFQAVLFQLVFAVVPTALELGITAAVLARRCGPKYALATLATFVSYCTFTSWMTEWRMRIRRKLVDVDNERNAYFVDVMANAETVKLFANERHEAARFDAYLGSIQKYNVRNTYAIAVLNVGQALIFSCGLTVVMLFTAIEVAAGRMSVGNIVAVNGLLLQLQHPFNFVGYTYQEIRQGFVDMRFMLELLQRAPEVQDTAGRAALLRKLKVNQEMKKRMELESPVQAPLITSTSISGSEVKSTSGLMLPAMGNALSSVASRILGATAVIRTKNSLRNFQARFFHEPEYASDAFLSSWLQDTATQAQREERGHARAADTPSRSKDDVDNLPNLAGGDGTEAVFSVVRGDIEFRDVSFAYNAVIKEISDDDPSACSQTRHSSVVASELKLHNVSFSVKAGETVALVGSSGSGKSTCLKLLTRLHDPTAGSVLLDGVNVKDIPLAEVRRHIGVVSQDTTLFDNTVAYNIRYGNLNASDIQVQRAAEAAQVHEAIVAQEQGYERRVGERGARLSGGERQRVRL